MTQQMLEVTTAEGEKLLTQSLLLYLYTHHHDVSYTPHSVYFLLFPYISVQNK